MSSEPHSHRGIPRRVGIRSLRLDPRNPRLPEGANTATQEALLTALATDYALTEVGRSMADNGFFEEEPLAVVADGDGLFTVVEGNRRTASLFLLTNRTAREALAQADRALAKTWESLAEIAASNGQTFDEVPVIEYEAREQLLTFLGYRHITGVQPWDPLAKARFVVSLIDDYGMDFAAAARRIGSRAATVREIYLAQKVYAQARDAGISTEKVENAYGVFSRAMSSSSLKLHIGITSVVQSSTDPESLKTPVPQERVPQLGEFVSWVAGAGDDPPVIQDSRQITDLGRVVASDEALAVLRDTRSLELAAEHTDAAAARLLKNLMTAKRSLEMAARDAAPGTGTPTTRDLVEECGRLVAELREAVEDAPAS